MVSISACHAEDPGSYSWPWRLFTLTFYCLLICATIFHTYRIVRGSIVVSISACHAEDPGSIPALGGYSLLHFTVY